MKLYKLKLKSSIHLGQREGVLEETDTIVHSDTFFSAFCINYSLLYGERELEGLINEFKNGNFKRPSEIVKNFDEIKKLIAGGE